MLERDHKLDRLAVLEMTPWQLDVKLLQIQRDLEQEADRLKKQKSQMELNLGL